MKQRRRKLNHHAIIANKLQLDVRPKMSLKIDILSSYVRLYQAIKLLKEVGRTFKKVQLAQADIRDNINIFFGPAKKNEAMSWHFHITRLPLLALHSLQRNRNNFFSLPNDCLWKWAPLIKGSKPHSHTQWGRIYTQIPSVRQERRLLSLGNDRVCVCSSHVFPRSGLFPSGLV